MSGKARIGVIGLGNMGSQHVRELADMEGVELAAVCDLERDKADAAAAKYGARAFYDAGALLDSGLVDGIVIATPHYDHPTIAIEAFRRGVSVCSEKPIAVHVEDAKRMIASFEEARKAKPSLVFTAMFQQRTQGNWMKAKELVESGSLGKIVRATWIITDWFRTQAYYNSGGWRATWRGEGGGVLMNQCPHNLDLLQWLVGMPKRVTAFASLGKYHDIEVEDEVTAYLEFEGGGVGHFITTTAESPGTNRLEIVGEMGKLVCEKGRLFFSKNEKSMLAHLREAEGAWEKLGFEESEPAIEGPMSGNHRIVLEDFGRSIREGGAPRIDGREGINMVTLDNAIMYSALERKTVELPLPPGAFEARLRELAASSRFVKKAVGPSSGGDGFSQSFGR
jgi:predicted dehydrogenase